MAGGDCRRCWHGCHQVGLLRHFRINRAKSCHSQPAQGCVGLRYGSTKAAKLLLDLRVMDEKIRLWLGAEDMDEDDRQALETVRDVISDLISRPG